LRPRVSGDDAFVESLFRTAKYLPEFPDGGFADPRQARARAARFVHGYNHEHKHGAIRCVCPAQRRDGRDHANLAARHEPYLQARQRHRRRWSGAARSWTPIAAVTLNQGRKAAVGKRRGLANEQPLAA
jgi:hypothetical protein